MKKYLFGPVPSRRFGRSLGIDLTPFKTCTLDCIFCQLGQTTVKTCERKDYVPIEAVKREISDWLSSDGKADYITLAGSGEPTLHSRFGEIIEFVHGCSEIPVALLTNGTTLHLHDVRAAASQADVVKVTLSAWDQTSFCRIHRPCEGVTFEQLVSGQRQLRAEFAGKMWMEVFLLGGINSAPEQVERIADLAKQIKPDRIHLNACVRPPSEDFALAVPEKQMVEIAKIFGPSAEVTAEFHAAVHDTFEANEATLLNMLLRRPCTVAQIAQTTGMHLNEISKYIGNLLHAGLICEERHNLELYYRAHDKNGK